MYMYDPSPLLTKQTGDLPQNPMKSRSRETGWFNDRITVKFDRHFDSATSGVPVKFKSDSKGLNQNLAASRIHEILR